MNLVICGDFEHFGLEISNPEETLVSSIIERVATSLDIPSVEISLYFNDTLLQPASPLSPQCGTQLRSGAALLVVVANPLTITIQRYDADVSFNVEISRLAAPQWTTDTLFDFCLCKAGMPKRINGKYVFTVQGTVLKEGKTICDYKFLNSNFTISITFLQALVCQKDMEDSTAGTRSVLIPTGCTGDKMLSSEQTKFTRPRVFGFFRELSRCGEIQFGNSSRRQSKWYGRWKFTIQAIDGTKKIVELKNHFLTPVYELKREVSYSRENIRLTIGKTVLEDFDEAGHIMLLCSYPQLHDGATLYQINLPDAMSVKCQYRVGYPSRSNKTQILHRALESELDENFTIRRPQFICIENPKNFTVERLVGAIENFGRITSVQTNEGKSMTSIYELPHDAVFSSIKCVVLE